MQGAAERLLPSGKEGAAADEAKGEAGATVQSAIFNLSNTIIGSGVLAMPFACYRCGTILFVILVAVTAFASHTAMVILIGAAEKLRDKLREDARMRKHNTAPASEAGSRRLSSSTSSACLMFAICSLAFAVCDCGSHATLSTPV